VQPAWKNGYFHLTSMETGWGGGNVLGFQFREWEKSGGICPGVNVLHHVSSVVYRSFSFHVICVSACEDVHFGVHDRT